MSDASTHTSTPKLSLALIVITGSQRRAAKWTGPRAKRVSRVFPNGILVHRRAGSAVLIYDSVVPRSFRCCETCLEESGERDG